MGARFSRPVLPGDDVVVEVWRTGHTTAAFIARNSAGQVVLDQGYCRVEPASGLTG